jgi:acetyl esterase
MWRGCGRAFGLIAAAEAGRYAGVTFIFGGFMSAALDPVIAQIIPLLPLRDPDTMTPQCACDAFRALAAGRAAVPPRQVLSATDIDVQAAAGRLAARVYRVSLQKSASL